MDTEFKAKYGKWALITGATSGIGAELADQVAANGVNVILVARRENELRQHAAMLTQKHDIETRYVVADLSTPEGVEAVKSIELDVGLLIPAAGMEVNGAFEKTSVEAEVKLLQINVISTFQLVHHFSAQMVERGRGGILMISSLAGHMAFPFFSNYAGSKAYVLNLGASLYGELKPKGVDITVLSPGLTDTPMVADNGMDWNKMPMKSMSPGDVAAAALDGLGKRFVTVPGGLNKLMVSMVNHGPTEMAIKMNANMVRKAIHTDKL